MATLVSVNIGKPEPIATRSGISGIFKRPVSGPVAITPEGLEGDAIVDRKNHGGVDQAVYVYFADDYARWSETLGRPMPFGTLGENLTIDGIEGRSVGVGDRFATGDALLEVTAHRTPCATLAARMNDPGILKAFYRAGRPGAYCRVLVPGSVSAGIPVEHRRFEGEPVPVAELLALDGEREIAPDVLRRILAAPVHHKMRASLNERFPHFL